MSTLAQLDTEKRRGTKPILSDAQVVAAHKLHMDGGLSINELARRGWKVWGFKSAEGASSGLRAGFARLGLERRSREAAVKLALTKHGLSAKEVRKDRNHPKRRQYRAYERQRDREKGDVHGRACDGVTTRGTPCKAPALNDSSFCHAHDERYREKVAEIARTNVRNSWSHRKE